MEFRDSFPICLQGALLVTEDATGVLSTGKHFQSSSGWNKTDPLQPLPPVTEKDQEMRQGNTHMHQAI